MASVNKVILIGHLGQDPEVRHTGSGKAVCNLSLATSESWTGNDGKREERTEWHRIVAWGKTAENAGRYLAKGRQVYVEGRIQSREWEDKGGAKRTSFEIVADRLLFLGRNEEGRDKSGRDEQDREEPRDRDADLPF